MSETLRLKRLPIAVCGAAGFVLLMASGFLMNTDSLSAAIVALIVCCGATGLGAGAWAGFKGGKHGAWAGFIAAACVSIYALISMLAFNALAMFGLSTALVVVALVINILLNFAIGISMGAAGGRLGARIRPAKKGIAPPAVDEAGQEDAQPQHHE